MTVFFLFVQITDAKFKQFWMLSPETESENGNKD